MSPRERTPHWSYENWIAHRRPTSNRCGVLGFARDLHGEPAHGLWLGQMKAFYSFRGNCELGDVTWRKLGGTPGIRAAFANLLAALDPEVFGAASGTVRVATGSPDEPVIETWQLAELESRWTDSHYLIDARLDLEPTVFAHDGELELVELDLEEWPMGMVPLRARGDRWAIVGRPANAAGESLLFVELDFDGYADGEADRKTMIAWLRTKPDLWLAYGLDGEPTSNDQRASRDLLIAALHRLADVTGGVLELQELARAP